MAKEQQERPEQKSEQEKKVKAAQENGDNPEALFWADQLADTIINRGIFKYTNQKIKPPKEFIVKTSASLSGVLHIGRLSDTIRANTVHKALLAAGAKSKLIWVSEDMDPLRKVPAGVPKDFGKYLGTAVTDIPDPDGCHSSYGEHHREEYLKVIHDFVDTKMEVFSMREEYRKGAFAPYIKKIMENIDEVRKILLRYRDSPLPEGWSPFTPICAKCGKIATPKITSFEDGKVHYTCSDYSFETTAAKGCDHKGAADPLADPGKLMWKSEWASQWARWNVCSEGAGKEYQVPNSAFWVNAEIAENILKYPHPVPIFYEHLMIDNKKMSASVGNVVYPKDWLEVATPELLRLFYNKRLMKTRSFSWTDLPRLYDEYDRMALQFSGEQEPDSGNVKKEGHLRRLFGMSHGKEIGSPVKLGFSHAVMIAQFFDREDDIIRTLEKTGQWDEYRKKEIFDRMKKARAWLKKYAPADSRLELQAEIDPEIRKKLNEKQRIALKNIPEMLKEQEWDEKELHNRFYLLCEELQLDSKDFFRAAYLVLFRKERGPQLANFILTLGERATRLFEKL